MIIRRVSGTVLTVVWWRHYADIRLSMARNSLPTMNPLFLPAKTGRPEFGRLQTAHCSLRSQATRAQLEKQFFRTMGSVCLVPVGTIPRAYGTATMADC